MALCGGTALFLASDVAFRARSLGVVDLPRLIAAALCVAVIAIAGQVDAPVALACIAVVCVALVAHEAVPAQAAGG